MQKTLIVVMLGALAATALPAAARAEGAKCPQILIVMDRTGSMTQSLASGEQKWKVISKAVTDFTAKYSMSIRFGFEYYNGAGCTMPKMTDPCSPGCLVFDPKDNAGPDVAKAVAALKPAGTTSTWETMDPIKDYMPLKDTTYNNFVLLITDGLPNCTEEMDPMAMGGYSGKKSVAAIKAIADGGVPVFVMGVGVKGAAGVPALNPDILDMMAEAGGVPQPPPAMHKFYAADNPMEVDAALEAIAGKAGGGTIGGCFAGGGMGGSGSGGSGGGGGGSGGGAGGQGGQGAFEGGHGTERSAPGCACALGGEPAGIGGGLLFGVMIAGAGMARRARRRR